MPRNTSFNVEERHAKCIGLRLRSLLWAASQSRINALIAMLGHLLKEYSMLLHYQCMNSGEFVILGLPEMK